MNKKVLIGACVAFLMLSGAALAYASGFLAPERQGYPPCDQLPSVSDVRQALDQNKVVADKITALGKDIEITVARPCKDVPEAALIDVRYDTKEELTQIEAFINTSVTFGVPMITSKR